MRRLTLLLIALLTLGLIQVSAQTEDEGFFRFVHAIPGVGPVDVYINGDLSIVGLSYGVGSNYVSVPAGDHQLTVRPTGLTTELWRQPVFAASGQPTILIASGIDPLEFRAFEDDFSTVDLGTTRLRFIHTIEGGPAVDVLFDGQAVTSDLSYNTSSGGFDLPADFYTFSIAAASGELASPEFSLLSNTSHTVVIYGTPNAPQILQLTAPTFADTGAAFVRIAHTADAPAVDIFVDEVLLAAGLQFGDVTSHLQIPEGAYSVSIRAAGTDDELFGASLEFDAGAALTIAALGSLDELTVNVFEDNVSEVNEGQAVVSVINTVPDSEVSLALANDIELADSVAFNTAGDPVIVEPVRTGGTLEISIDGESLTAEIPSTTFYGGVYTNAFIVLDAESGEASVIFAPTTLAQTVASAPGTTRPTVVQAEPTVEAVTTEEPEEVVEEPVEEEVEEIVEEPSEESELTVAEEVVEATAAPEPTVAPTSPPVVVATGPTARVQIDPGANLNLREYPRQDAFILAQAPSGATLRVLGRAGAPLDSDGQPPEDFVDPLTLLEENQDLAANETWLNVIYSTPDGGEVNAWINAQFILLRDARGNLGRLRDLDTIPASQPGQAVNTAIGPPADIRDDPFRNAYVATIEINPGVNLNLRRDPNAQSEVVAQIPSGSRVVVVGRTADATWLQTSFDGVSGWIASNFVFVTYNGVLVNIEDVPVTVGAIEAETDN